MNQRFTSKRRVVLLVLLAGAVLGLALVRFIGTNDAAPTETWAGEVEITVPLIVDAGDAFDAVVRAVPPANTTATVVLFGALDTFSQEVNLVDGSADITFDGSLTDHAGRIDLLVAIGGMKTLAHVISVAGEPVDPVVPLVGPRTIIANGDDFTMSVSSPQDEFGNAVANGTAVVTEALRPDGATNSVTTPVAGGVAAAIVVSTTEVGRIALATTAGDATGPTNIVDQVAGLPAPFEIEVDRRNAFADGFALHEMVTTTLFDTFGNELPDGISATFVIDDLEGRSFVEATVQGGVARALLQAPALPGTVTISARVSGRESQETSIVFETGVIALPVEAERIGDDVIVNVGRVLAARGGYPPDGTPVQLIEPETGVAVMTGSLREGLVTLTAPTTVFADGLVVEVLGRATLTEIGGR